MLLCRLRAAQVPPQAQGLQTAAAWLSCRPSTGTNIHTHSHSNLTAYHMCCTLQVVQGAHAGTSLLASGEGSCRLLHLWRCRILPSALCHNPEQLNLLSTSRPWCREVRKCCWAQLRQLLQRLLMFGRLSGNCLLQLTSWLCGAESACFTSSGQHELLHWQQQLHILLATPCTQQLLRSLLRYVHINQRPQGVLVPCSAHGSDKLQLFVQLCTPLGSRITFGQTCR